MTPTPAIQDTGATVHVVDDDAALRDALSFLFESRGMSVRAFDGGAALLDWLSAMSEAGQAVAGCFLLDVRMEGMSGLVLHDALRAQGLRHPVLFLTGHGDIPLAVEALKNGAFDFIEKPASDNSLADRVAQALAVDAAMRQQGARAAEIAARLASLTPREHEVMLLVVAGKLNKVIAQDLAVSVRTIEVTRARVFSKLAVRSAAEAATLLSRARPPTD